MATGLITVGEYAKGLANEDIRKVPIEMFAKSADVYDALPFEGLKGSVFQFYRQAVLPVPGFRGINETSTSGHGTITPLQENTAIIDHDIDVDRAIIRRHGPERRTTEEQMGMTAFGQLWVTTFVSGDQSTNPRVFNGLQQRSGKYGRTSHNSAASGGAALSLLKLDQAINLVNGATHIFAPYDSRPLWIQAARTSALTGFVMQTFGGGGETDVGGLKMSYAGLKFLWGYPKDDHPAPLQFNEVASGGGSAVTASLYIMALGAGKLRGLQLAPMEVVDQGLLENGITYRTHLSWDCGVVDEHKYCLQRFDSWTNAAIVA
jgi:hypothetical protein